MYIYNITYILNIYCLINDMFLNFLMKYFFVSHRWTDIIKLIKRCSNNIIVPIIRLNNIKESRKTAVYFNGTLWIYFKKNMQMINI